MSPIDPHEPCPGDFYTSRDYRDKGRTVRLIHWYEVGNRWRVENVDTGHKSTITARVLRSRFDFRADIHA